MVLILLAKPIAIYVRIALIKVWKPSLEGLFLELCLTLSRLSLGLQIGLHELFEKLIGRSWSWSSYNIQSGSGGRGMRDSRH